MNPSLLYLNGYISSEMSPQGEFREVCKLYAGSSYDKKNNYKYLMTQLQNKSLRPNQHSKTEPAFQFIHVVDVSPKFSLPRYEKHLIEHLRKVVFNFTSKNPDSENVLFCLNQKLPTSEKSVPNSFSYDKICNQLGDHCSLETFIQRFFSHYYVHNDNEFYKEIILEEIENRFLNLPDIKHYG